jgi:hypothetical protein
MKEKKEGEPKKSTGRDGGQSNSKQDKQTHLKKRKKKEKRKKILSSGRVEFQS